MARAVDTTKPKKKLIAYRYVATDSKGKSVKGNVKAEREIDAERLIIDQGYSPISVEVVPSMFSLEEALPTLFQVKPRDVIIFSRQLATLLRAGFSLLPALQVLQGQVTSSRAFKKALESIIGDLRGGGSFSQALSKYPKAFSEIYTRTMAVGEQSGSMETVLNQMADYLEKQGAMAKKVGGALTYPVMVLGVGLVVGVVMIVVVMPQMSSMFASANLALPLPTRMLLELSRILTTYWLYFTIAVVVIAIAVIWSVKQPAGKRILDGIRLKAPLIGTPLLLGELGRFSRTMSVLIHAGLSLQEIMDIVPQASNNQVIRDAFAQVREGLMLGEGLSEPMSRLKIFPPLLVQMVSVGEESNTLDFTMGVVADFYETTAEEKTASMVGMIGPLSTIGIAIFVGFIAVSVLMPMYTITGAFG
ncbi:MAG: type II secretion system F family protein [Dehalococcoidales bacterium]|nr:type II secretion system F family protein [Dehalococcoidales bacterium]